MADHFVSKDNSKRITYRHYLGHDLNENNTGRMKFGDRYCKKHIDVYRECKRVLKPDGLFIVNVSDHIRKGEIVPVVDWHKNALIDLGFKYMNYVAVETPRMRFGKNNGSRVKNEVVLIFNK
jgi:DNA modification methylase